MTITLLNLTLYFGQSDDAWRARVREEAMRLRGDVDVNPKRAVSWLVGRTGLKWVYTIRGLG